LAKPNSKYFKNRKIKLIKPLINISKSDKDDVLKDEDKEIYYKSGQRSVVNHLINQYNIQQEN
jgi:hypothetical protein